MSISKRTHGLPDLYTKAISPLLEPLGFSLAEPRGLAAAVLKLSDYYLAHPSGQTPWHESWAQVASLVYFFPLNYARNFAVAREAQRLGFFSGISRLIDFGSGTGSALHALKDHGIRLPSIAIDRSELPLKLSEALDQDLAKQGRGTFLIDDDGSNIAQRALRGEGRTTAIVSSYALTELSHLPEWWKEAEALMIVEPSTQDDGRKLLQHRADLISAGYKIWAPCTHQGPCPLMMHSARDWCHDRIHWQPPIWFEKMEAHLPMKNRTITYGYLLARKSLNPSEKLLRLARLTGDRLEEKGKTRQSICRGTEREFLAWFPQRMNPKPGHEQALELERGHLVQFNRELEKKSNELRLKDDSDIRVFEEAEDFT